MFHDFLEDIDEDVLPNKLVGYENTLVWKKLFNFQHDTAIGIINKLESYNGCILADSVGLGKTFTALEVIKYYELRNKSVLVLVPKKLADNWLTYNRNLVTNIFVKERFNDLRNQLALAYEGESEQLRERIGIQSSIEQVFKEAQMAFNEWSRLPAEERTTTQILSLLNFDFFKLLDSVIIARSRRHIQQFYDTSEIGAFPTRLAPISHHIGITDLSTVMDLNAIYTELSALSLAVYTPITYILASRLKKYEDLYDTQVVIPPKNPSSDK